MNYWILFAVMGGVEIPYLPSVAHDQGYAHLYRTQSECEEARKKTSFNTGFHFAEEVLGSACVEAIHVKEGYLQSYNYKGENITGLVFDNQNYR